MKSKPDSPGIWWVRCFGEVQPVEVMPSVKSVYIIGEEDRFAPTDDIFSGPWLKADVPELPLGKAVQ